MNFWNDFWGTVQVELTSAAPEAAFGAIGKENIQISKLRQVNDLTFTFWITRRKYVALCRICQKRGENLKLLKKRGAYWIAKKAGQRPVLVLGSTILFALVLWLPTRVFFLQVEGNGQIPDRRILAAAQDCGITFGASRREVRSEQVKNALLSAVPELQWAGVNTSGCKAIISVRERTDARDETPRQMPASLTALRDGYILSCTATRGTALVKPGQSVKEGQLLISAYTDCGLSIRAERAEGEVLAQTNRELKAVMPMVSLKKEQLTGVKRKISLLLGKKRINLWKDSGIWEGTCGRMYEEYYITLPGDFQLPAALCVEDYICGDLTPSEVEYSEAEAELKAFAGRTLTQQMVAGKILTGLHTVETDAGRYLLKGRYACIEMIGKLRQEQIGDTNGKIN